MYTYVVMHTHVHMTGGLYTSIASYPGLLTPAIYHLQYWCREGLVKPSYVQWHTWTCGGVAHSRKTATVQPIANTDHRTTEHSTSDSLGDTSVQLYRRNVPLLHTSSTSLYGLPPALVLQATNSGVRRPEYKANTSTHRLEQGWGVKQW